MTLPVFERNGFTRPRCAGNQPVTVSHPGSKNSSVSGVRAINRGSLIDILQFPAWSIGNVRQREYVYEEKIT